jgi:hypothetical protein
MLSQQSESHKQPSINARVIQWLWSNVVKNKFQGGVRSFED